MNLSGARADSQDRLVQRIIGSQETLAGASPTTSATEVPSKVREFRFSSLLQYYHKVLAVWDLTRGSGVEVFKCVYAKAMREKGKGRLL